MTGQEAVQIVYNGGTIVKDCLASEFDEVRLALQEGAAKMIDQGQDIRAMIMLEEVRKLNIKFPF